MSMLRVLSTILIFRALDFSVMFFRVIQIDGVMIRGFYDFYGLTFNI